MQRYIIFLFLGVECLIFARENGEVVWPLNGRWQDWRNIDLTTSWYRVTCDESGYIVIEVQPKTPESQGNRTVAFRLESDDAFATMTFIQ